MQRASGSFLATCLLLACPVVHSQEPRSVTVFAAASLTDAINELSAAFLEETGIVVKPSFAATSVLARQIEAGAQAGVFMSADEEWMNYLDERGLLARGSRRDLLANRLVLIAERGAAGRVRLLPPDQFVTALGDAKIATGDPESVPVGRYARLAFLGLGIWDEVAPRIVPAENVRTALAYVARGEIPFGVAYATDATLDSRVVALDVFPETSHPPIVYPIAATKGADPHAIRFLRFASDATATRIFERFGFTVLR